MILKKGSYLCCPNCGTILFKTLRDLDTHLPVMCEHVLDTKSNSSQPHGSRIKNCWCCDVSPNSLSNLTIINNLYYI